MATRFLTNNVIDNATLFAYPSEYSGLPVSNVKKLSKSLVARLQSTPPSSFSEVQGTLAGQANTINCFIICGHNFKSSTILNIKLYSDYSYTSGSLLWSSGPFTVPSIRATDTYNVNINIPIWLPESIENVAAFSFTMQDDTLNYFQIYRLFAGEYFDSSIGASLNNTWYYNDNSKQYRTDFGSLRTDIVTPSKLIDFDLGTINDLERSSLARSLASVGMYKEFFISVFKNSCDETIKPLKELDYSGVVKLISVPKYTEFANKYYNTKIVVEEV